MNTVNPPLTAKRRRKVRENPEYHAFARRGIRAYGRRIAAGDVEGLPGMLTLAAELDEATRAAVAGLREFGYSWAEIGARVGLTKQACQQRWGQSCQS